MTIVRLLLICLTAIAGTSCVREKISVFSEYVTRETLASYFVGTPDPLLNNPPIGQKLYVKWDLDKSYLMHPNLQLQLKIRFRNRQEDVVSIPICTTNGTYVYSLLNADYFAAKGIWTYKIELISEGTVLEQWLHQIWANWIAFEENGPCSTQEEEEEPQMDEEYDF